MYNNEALLERVKNGDTSARDLIVEGNVGLVWNVAKKFYNRGHEPDDIFQIGCIGLVKAIDKFDDSFGVKFSTYAVPMIMGEIKRFLRDDGIIKVSRSLKELNYKASRAREEITKTLNREPTVLEIADKLGVDVEELVAAMDANITPDSLQAEISNSNSSTLLENTPAKNNVEDEVTKKIALQQALSKFKSRERQIIMLRYFAEKTQTQISKILGISQVQVSRIEKKVLAAIANEMES